MPKFQNKRKERKILIKNKISKSIAAAIIMTVGISTLSPMNAFGISAGETVMLNSDTRAYVNSEAALNGSDEGYKIYSASEYYVYKVAGGAVNITRNPGTPGGWVSISEVSSLNYSDAEENETAPQTEETPVTTTAAKKSSDVSADSSVSEDASAAVSESAKKYSPSASSGNKVTLGSTVRAYSNAASAVAGSGNYVNYSSAEYYIYKTADGATNITRTPGVPGGWVSDSDLYNTKRPDEVKPTSPSKETTVPAKTTAAETKPSPVSTTTKTNAPSSDSSTVKITAGIKGYSNAESAVNGSGNYVNYSASTYYIYKTVSGATNISRTPGIPGAWVSNNDLESAKSGITTQETPKTPAPVTTTTPKPATTTTAAKSSSANGDKETWMSNAGIAESNWKYVDYIVSKESGWNYKIANPYSGAYGLPQAYPGNKMSSAGSDWQTNPVTQLKWMESYVNSRYGGWKNAYDFWLNNHWY